jgi:phosphoserine/homoserine phosphotransferase
MKPTILAMDLEGVLIPEIWIAFAKKTGIEKLKLTTRDISDYDVLMKGRLEILKEHSLKLKDIQDVISTLSPLEGALSFVRWAKENIQLVILSDTFYEFAQPMMRALEFPTLFCHSLITDDSGYIIDYKIRIKDPKKKAVKSFKDLNFNVIAVGDSYNDTTMLLEADKGILFKAPDNVKQEFNQLTAFENYEDLKNEIKKQLERL